MDIIDMAELHGVPIPADSSDNEWEPYRWHADWRVCTQTRTATHISGLSYVFKPWGSGVKDAPPTLCSWPDARWCAVRVKEGRPTAPRTALRRCLEACRLFHEHGMFLCFDCNVNTSESGDYYMVQEAVWRTARPEGTGMLCLDCLQKRLGRTLLRADFTECLVNRESEKVQAIKRG